MVSVPVASHLLVANGPVRRKKAVVTGTSFIFLCQVGGPSQGETCDKTDVSGQHSDRTGRDLQRIPAYVSARRCRNSPTCQELAWCALYNPGDAPGTT